MDEVPDQAEPSCRSCRRDDYAKPRQLLIGAAHAGCFTMALSLILGEAKLTADRMETTAEVTLEKVTDGFTITAVHLCRARTR